LRVIASLVIGMTMLIAGGTACSPSFTGTEVRSGLPHEPPARRAIANSAGPVAALTGPTLRLLGDSEGANVAFSPTLLARQLSVLRTGADGSAAGGIGAIVNVSDNDAVAQQLAPMAAAGTLLEQRSGPRRSADRSGTVLVEQRDSLWVQRGTVVAESFLDNLSRWFAAGVRQVDFRSNPEAARQAINQWADRTSVGRVVELVPRGRIDSSTRLLSTGYTWMAGPWLVAFDTADTIDAPFTTSGGARIDVPTMRVTASAGLSHGAGSGWQAVELPYLGRELSMVVVVPDSERPDAVNTLLEPSLVDDVLGSLRRQPVALQLPRFAFTSTTSLLLPLGGLGAASAFSADEGGFDPLAPGEDLVLDDVIQQVFMAADEQGTAASAATVVSAQQPPAVPTVDVTADRPFVVLVVEQSSGLVALAGLVGDPRR